MTRRDFMAELARRLAALPEGERRDALQYYEEYFDDAGPEMEGAVLAELKSPAAVAARLGGWSGALAEKADPGQQAPGRQPDTGKPFGAAGESSEREPSFSHWKVGQKGWETEQKGWETGQKGWQQAASEPEPAETHRSGGFWAAVILLSPIWAPLLLAAVVVLGALVISAAAVIFALGVTVLALILCCVLCLAVGLKQTFTD
ncbi:MAG: hypothetical protein PUC47_03010, partial [Oscillospiraceae bacterium]|nr:hypothetical protein [Oscillospiraceae bacterium]